MDMVYESIKSVFSSIGEAFMFYKEQFTRVMLIGLTIILPMELFLTIVKQLSFLYPQLDSLYYMVIPVVLSIAQLPLVYLSHLFIKDELLETSEIYSFFFRKITNAYVTSLFFIVLMILLMSISQSLWVIGIFLSFSIPYLLVIKEYRTFDYITQSVKLGLIKWLQLLILLSSFYLIGLGINRGLFAAIDLLAHGTTPQLFYLVLQWILHLLLIPLAVFILTRSYFKWLIEE
ncbi:hypothetical protein [Laceyella putida]|uniref:Uncharacterized protein n=1 Tax=Laceyella putida TaxID=110101 RepID=A0ABW2RR11_9BACL